MIVRRPATPTHDQFHDIFSVFKGKPGLFLDIGREMARKISEDDCSD
jgi:hypothetical protein